MRSDLPRGAHVFIDETKARGFVLVGVVVAPAELKTARQKLPALVVSGRRRVHFKKLTCSGEDIGVIASPG